MQVWKSLIPNTGRALREILPSLMNNVITALSSEDGDHITVAGRCLGDIVKKLGERVLPAVVPTLREVRISIACVVMSYLWHGALPQIGAMNYTYGMLKLLMLATAITAGAVGLIGRSSWRVSHGSPFSLTHVHTVRVYSTPHRLHALMCRA